MRPPRAVENVGDEVLPPDVVDCVGGGAGEHAGTNRVAIVGEQCTSVWSNQMNTRDTNGLKCSRRSFPL